MEHNNATQYVMQPTCMSAYSVRHFLDNEECIALGLITVLLIPFTAITNAVLIAVTIMDRRKKKLLTASIMIVMTLAIANMSIAILHQPIVALLYLGLNRSQSFCWLDASAQAISTFLNHVTQWMICLMAADRFLRMSSTNGGRLQVNSAWMLLAIGCSYSLTVAAVSCISMQISSYIVTQIIVFGTDVMLFLTTLAFYIGLIVRIRVHVSKSAVYKGTRTIPSQYTKRLYRTVFAVLAVMFVCYFPSYSFTIYTWEVISKSGYDKLDKGLALASLSLRTFAYVNSGLNALILLYRNSHTEEVLRICLHRVTCQPHTPAASATSDYYQTNYSESRLPSGKYPSHVRSASFKVTHVREKDKQEPVAC